MLFPPNEAVGLIGQVERLIGSPELAARIGAAGRQSIDDRGMTWSGNATRVVEQFEQAREGAL